MDDRLATFFTHHPLDEESSRKERNIRLVFLVVMKESSRRYLEMPKELYKAIVRAIGSFEGQTLDAARIAEKWNGVGVAFRIRYSRVSFLFGFFVREYEIMKRRYDV